MLMRIRILLLICLCISIVSRAQTLTISTDGKTATISGATAGCLVGTTVISATQKTSITNLTVSGTIDASDINVMKVSMPALADIDLSAATIAAYTGTAGTNGATSQTYTANTIPARAFYYVSRVKTFKTPTNATTIASQAFCWANGMTALSIPSTVTSITTNAFYNCTAIVTVDAANTAFASDSYGIVYGLTSGAKTSIFSAPSSSTLNTVDYVAPSGITSVGAYAFEMNNFHSITLPSTTTTIGTNAFEGATASSIYVPAAVSSIGNYAFLNCNAIVTINASNTKYASDATYGIIYGLTSGVKTSIFQASTSTTLNSLDYTVPATVTSIGAYAFNNNNLHSVTTTSVTNIGTYAFSTCNIPTIAITSPVTVMGAYAFNAANTTSLDLTGVVNLSGAYLLQNSKITTLTLSPSLTTIGQGAFANITNLASVTLPASVTSIGLNPFINSSCLINVDASNANFSSDANGILYDKNKTTLIVVPTSLTGSFVIPGTVTTLSANSFYYTKLSSITIPASVTNIGATAFQNVSTANLTQIHAQGTTPSAITLGATVFSGLSASKVAIFVPDMAAATLYGAAAQWLAYPLVREQPVVINVPTAGTLASLLTTGEKTSLPALKVTGSLNAVDFKTINSITKLTSIDLSGVTSIEAYTGTAGPIATSTTYPANEIPQSSFNGKTLLTNIVLPSNGITSIGQLAFKGCTALSSISIPDNVNTIGINAFENCTALTTVHLPESLKTIPYYGFSGCSLLANINIPSTITSVDYAAFYNCAKLTTVALPSTVQTIAGYAFAGCSLLSDITLPSALTTIDQRAFLSCAALTNVTVPSTVTTIGTSAFYGCSALKSIIIPSGVTSLDQTFGNCSALTSVTLSDNIQVLNANLFLNCTALKAINLPTKLKTFNASAFTGCSVLDSVAIDNSNIYYSTNNGVLYNLPKTVLIYCPTGKKGIFTMLPTVKIIGAYAFSGCNGITAINFGTSRPTTFEGYAFQNCTGLTTITIPSSVTSMQNFAGGGVFLGCTNLSINYESGANYVLVDGVTFTADMKTLVSCPTTKTGNYVIPDGVTKIDDGAFASSSLTSVVMPSSVTSMGSWAFLGATQLTTVSLSSNLTKLPWQCFFGCPLLRSVVVPSGVTVIEQGAFYNDYQLRSVTLPEGLTRLGHYAFQNCPITSIVLPKSLKSVGVGAFGEDFLLSIEFPAGFEKFDGDGVFWNQVRTLKMNNTEPIDITMALGFAPSAIKTNAALIVPAGSKTKYANAPGWKDFKNIIEDGAAVDLAVTSTAGGLSAAIRNLGYSILNVKKLAISGNINSIDIKMMRDSMLLLSDIDMSAATIDAITTATTAGTTTSSVTYAANTLPINAFINCKRIINTLLLPNNLTTIDASAFYSARGVKSVYIPASVSTLNTPLTYDNFTAYTVDPANPNFMSDGVAVYNKAQTVLHAVSNSATGSYNIAPTVTSILGYALYGSQLTSVGLPPTISSTGYYTFSNCTALSYTSYSTNPVAVNAYTFYATNAAAKLYVPAGTKAAYLAVSTWSSNFGSSRIIEMSSTTKAITAGNLATTLTSAEKTGLIKLKLTGTMDARDFKFIRDSLNTLTSLDLSGISVVALNNSTEGTAGNTAINYPANVIPASAFLNKNIIDSIALPAVLDSIGNSAFKGCTRLAYAPLPPTITSVAAAAFAGCDKLTDAQLPNVTTLGDKVFSGCSSLKNVTLTALSAMGQNIFTGCTSLAAVSLPSAITMLPKGTFSGCSSLSSVSIPGVSSIGEDAFSACIKLSSIDLSNVTNMGRAAFSGCQGLKTVTLPGATVIADNAFAACSGLTTLTIPSTVTTLSAYSFLNCTGLTSVTIPKSVNYIAPTAFEGCTGLMLSFESGSNYFADTDGVVYTSAAKTCLVSCPASKSGSFVLPASVVQIKAGAFEGCLNLTSVTLPAALTAIPDSAFLDCASLNEVIFNSGLTSIGKWAFGNCVKLVNAELPSTLTSIGVSGFENCNMLEKINIPTGVTTLSDRLLANCFRLINFKIPSGVTSIGSEVFTSFYAGAGVNLGNLIIPASVSSISKYAFKNATINTITAQNSVPIEFDQANVFYTLSKNTPLYVPVGTVSAYKNTAQWNDFNFIMEPSELTVAVTPGQLTNLLTAEQKIQVQKLKLTGTMDARDFQTMKTELIGIIEIDLSEVSIVAYTGTAGTAGTTSISYPADEIPASAMGVNYKSVALPTNIKSIGASAFNSCTLITSLSLPNTLTSIGTSAFAGCIRLSDINIPTSVATVGDGAFSGCSTLPSITIPEGTTTIGASTFQNCINLTSVGLPSTVTSIGAKAFMSCEKLKTILIYANVNSIGGYAFANCAGLDTIYAKPSTPIALGTNAGATPYVFYGKKSSCTLRVPEYSKTAYLTAEQWKDFGTDNILEEAWYGKKVIYTFTGIAPNVVRSTDGKAIASGTKVEDGTVISFNVNYPAHYVRTLKSTPLGQKNYTYYAPSSQTATSGTTDISVNENLVFTLTIDSAAVWSGSSNDAWDKPENWSSHYVPTKFDNVVIEQITNSTSAGDSSTCYNLTINSGKIEIPAGKILTVNGRIKNNTTNEGLIVRADEAGILPNGTLIFQNAPNETFRATVEMYSKSTTNLSALQGSKYNWQHFGIPVRNYDMSNLETNGFFVREYNESGTTDAKQWTMKMYEDVLSSFKGYEIAPNSDQAYGSKYSFIGELENRDFNSGLLRYTSGALNQGYNLLANPYTAAINMASINYGEDMLQTVYIYCTGSYNNWCAQNPVKGMNANATNRYAAPPKNVNTPGQYIAVPKELSGIGGLPSTIPSMQAFIVRAKGDVSDSINIPYVTSATKNTDLQRIGKSKANQLSSTKIMVQSNTNKADAMWIFSGEGLSHGFENGYDGEKMVGSTLNPQIYAVEASGNYQVDAVDAIDGTIISVKPGADSVYTLSFEHNDVRSQYPELYLIDLQTGFVTDISESGSQYTFAVNSTSNQRFKLATTATTTDSPDVRNTLLKVYANGNCITINNATSENGHLEILNMAGQRIKTWTFNANSTVSLQPQLSSGSYIVKAITPKQQKVQRIIVNIK